MEESKKCRQPVQPKLFQVDGLPKPSNAGFKESRRRCVGRLSSVSASQTQMMSTNDKNSENGIGARVDSHGLKQRHLPLCGHDSVGRDGAYVNNFQVRSRTVEEEPVIGFTDTANEHSQAN